MSLLENLLSDPYFHVTPPKSTGREYFNLNWVHQYLEIISGDISPVDVQTTLVELTALCILNDIQHHFSQGEILICGGGVHNHYLMTRLQSLTKTNFQVQSTKAYGIDPDWVEAIAFAWLARQTFNRQTGNLPNVTGARKAGILGGIYCR